LLLVIFQGLQKVTDEPKIFSLHLQREITDKDRQNHQHYCTQT
jgi:hypothetical protein